MAKPLISELAAEAKLLGQRLYRLECYCPPSGNLGELKVEFVIEVSLEGSKEHPNHAFSYIEVKLNAKNEEKDDEEPHQVFLIQMQGIYEWDREPGDGLEDSRLASMLARPLYATAVAELRKLSVTMDLGELKIRDWLTWPRDMPFNLDGDIKPNVSKRRVARSKTN